MGTLKTYEKEKEILKATQQNTNRLQSEFDELEWKHEILQQKHKQETQEFEVLESKYEDTLLDIQQKRGLKALIINKSIAQVEADIEKQDINFNEILSSMNIKQSTSNESAISSKLDDVIKVKDETIRHLENKKSSAKQKYFNMKNYYENLMNKYNVPISELGFIPNTDP